MKKSYWKIVVLLQALFVIFFVSEAFSKQLIADRAVDTVVEWGNGKAYFFMGSQYVRFDIKADRVDPGYPKSIKEWQRQGMPWADDIDAAVNWGNGKVYFFKGSQYMRFDIKLDRVDPGYPKSIKDWGLQ